MQIKCERMDLIVTFAVLTNRTEYGFNYKRDESYNNSLELRQHRAR